VKAFYRPVLTRACPGMCWQWCPFANGVRSRQPRCRGTPTVRAWTLAGPPRVPTPAQGPWRRGMLGRNVLRTRLRAHAGFRKGTCRRPRCCLCPLLVLCQRHVVVTRANDLCTALSLHSVWSTMHVLSPRVRRLLCRLFCRPVCRLLL
jgi:hypothetical protein